MDLISDQTIAQLYKLRWQIELFFRWIKQNLRIKSFYGTSENAVRTQIWVAITVYALVAIIQKRLLLELPLHTFLQILGVTVFENIPLNQLVTENGTHDSSIDDCDQLWLISRLAEGMSEFGMFVKKGGHPVSPTD